MSEKGFYRLVKDEEIVGNYRVKKCCKRYKVKFEIQLQNDRPGKVTGKGIAAFVLNIAVP